MPEALASELEADVSYSFAYSGEPWSVDRSAYPFADGGSRFRFIDLFAGIGGFRLGLQASGGNCVFSCDWDRSARTTYEANFGDHPFSDIRHFTGDTVTDSELDAAVPDHDLLAAGFPCQPFSRAGVSARNALGRASGFLDATQGTLFFDVARIVSVKRPRVVLLENVRNFLSHDGGRTHQTVVSVLEELGYAVTSQVVDARSLVPQKRQRVFIVGVLGGPAFEFPSFEGEPRKLREILESDVPKEFTISDRLWEGHQKRTQRNLDRGTGFTAFTADLDAPANTLVARYGKDGKECLIPQKGKPPRMLTPRECARLMGFPDEFRILVPKTSAYKQFGNSVVVPVVKRLGRATSGV